MVGIDAWGRTNEGAPRVDDKAEFASGVLLGISVQYCTVYYSGCSTVQYYYSITVLYSTVTANGQMWHQSDSHEGRGSQMEQF